MKSWIFGLALLPFFGGSITAAGTPAPAPEPQPELVCGPIKEGLKVVASKYHEHIFWVGEASSFSYILTKSDDGKTWTLFMVFPNGASCIAGSGAGRERM